MQSLNNFDNGKPFDWGKASEDYAKYRDIYPSEFYEKIHSLGIGAENQYILDLGTGTGVLPRNMAKYGALFVGTDLSENQIIEAKKLSAEQKLDFEFFASAAENVSFPAATFDAVTACQCFFYFDHSRLAPKLADMLKERGKLVVLYMGWLPFEDEIAGQSEKLVLKYNPDWTSFGDTRRNNFIPEIYDQFFVRKTEQTFDLELPFTRESWNGRIRACRGIGASLSEEEVRAFSKEHLELLGKIAPESFYIKHYAAISVLEKK